MTGIFISSDLLARLSEPTRLEISNLVLRLGSVDGEETENEMEVRATSLTIDQARNLVNGCAPKTLKALKAMVTRRGDFLMSEIAADLGETSADLRAVFGGITKRTRTVTGRPEAGLIEWTRLVGAGDWKGRIPTQTIDALSKALNRQ